MSAASGLRCSVSSSGLRPQVCSSTFFYLLLHPLFSVHHQLTYPWNTRERCRLGFHVDRNIGVFTATLWYRARHADGQPVVALPIDLHHPVVLSTAARCSSRRVSTRLHQGTPYHATVSVSVGHWGSATQDGLGKSNARLFHLPMLDHLPQVP